MSDKLHLKSVWVSHLGSVFGYDTRSGNESLFEACALDKRLLPFAMVNPSEEGWEREVLWASRLGARGVRLVPGYHQYALSHPSLARLIEVIQSLRLPLHVCARLQDERLQHHRFKTEAVPLHALAELIADVGNHPLIISGVNANEVDEINRYLQEGQSLEHVVFDLWHVNGPLAAIAHLCRKGLASRFAYGSCAPVQTAEATVLQLATAGIEESDRLLLACGNAQRLFAMA